MNLGSLRGDPRINWLAAHGPGRPFEFRGLAAGTYLVVAASDEDRKAGRGAEPLRIRQVALPRGEWVELVLGGAEEASSPSRSA